MACSLVQFSPETFGLPVGDGSFQAAVEASVVGGVQLQLPAEDAEGLHGAFTGSGLHEVLKQLAGLRRTFVLHLPHPSSVTHSFPLWTGDSVRGWLVLAFLGKEKEERALFVSTQGPKCHKCNDLPPTIRMWKKTSYIWVYSAVK